MGRQRPDLKFLIMILLLLAGGAGLAWLTQQYIVPLGGNEVYAPIWEASGNVISGRGENPYTEDAVARARILVSASKSPPRFVYPYYSIALFAPFSQISPYSLSRAVWMIFGLACYLGLVVATIQLTRWRPGFWGGTLFILFAFARPDVLRALLVGNPSLVVALLAALGLRMVVRERYGVAGFFFGLMILKPQLALLLLAYVLVYAVSKRQMAMVWTMLLVGVGVVGVSILIFPRWPLYNYLEMVAFFQETFPSSPAAVVWTWLPDTGPVTMAIVSVLAGAAMVIAWWQSLGKDSRWFLWTAALTIVITMLIGVPISLSDHVLLLVPFSLVFSTWVQRWKGSGTPLAVGVMVLTAGLVWVVFWQTMDFYFLAPPSGWIRLLLPLVALVLLYWVRYWALYSIQLRTSHLEALRKL